MSKRVYTLRVPSEGFVYRYGRAESWGDPEMCVAWAPGNKAAAYALASLINNNRAMLEERGVDIESLRITGRQVTP